jgi:hypothetical protein
MAIPRRLIAVAVSAVAAGAMFYVSSRLKQAQKDQNKKRGAVDETNDAKDTAEQNKKQEQNAAAATASSTSTTAAPATEGALRELALFLAGDAWHDEIGWQALWEKDGIAAPDTWLKELGRAVLVKERQKLTEHPALLAGCRRRWIVVCRYAGIDVGDAANVWNAAEA